MVSEAINIPEPQLQKSQQKYASFGSNCSYMYYAHVFFMRLLLSLFAWLNVAVIVVEGI